MQKIPWRKSAKITKHIMMEDDSAKLTDKIEAAIAETEQTGEFSSDIATEDKPKTTWIWDRSRQAWVEIIETHLIDEPLEADDVIDAQPVEPPSVDTTDSASPDFERPVRPRKIISPTAAPTNVIDTLTPREKSYSRLERTADTGRLQDMVKTDASANVGVELEESRQLILREAETQAEKIIAWAEERASAWADRIITQAQEKAEESVEGIIARAEEKAAIHADNIIARAEEKAIIQAESIIAKTEERAEALAENIIARAEERARIRANKIIVEADDVVSRTEARARVQADDIIARAEETHDQMISAAERQAHNILNTAQENSTGFSRPEKPSTTPPGRSPIDRIADMVTPQPIRQPTRQSMPQPTQQPKPQPKAAVPKEKSVSDEGNAELIIKPPVDLNIMQKALKRLTANNQVRILDLDGAVGKGVSVKLFTRNLSRLPDMIVALPEVEKVSELPKKMSRICPGQRLCPGRGKAGGTPEVRFLVQMQRRNTYLDTQET